MVKGLEADAPVRLIDVFENNMINSMADQTGKATFNISNLPAGA